MDVHVRAPAQADGHGQAAAQFGEADQQHAQALLGVHVEVGEEPGILEHVVAQVPGLVGRGEDM